MKRVSKTHGIHVWYIYLHLVDFYGKCIGKYTMHGSYGKWDVKKVNGTFAGPSLFPPVENGGSEFRVSSKKAKPTHPMSEFQT